MKVTKKLVFSVTAFALALLLVSSTFLGLFNPAGSVVDTSSAATGVKLAAEYGDYPSYGDLLQYEWPQGSGIDPGNTHFSDGPAPSAPNILWKFKGTGGTVAGFNGKIFARRGGASGRPGAPPGPPPITWALDPFTGDIIWTAPISGTPYKLDETHMLLGTTCVDPETGNVLWQGSGFSIRPYVPELKMSFAGLSAWNFSDLSQPPTVAWSRPDLLDIDIRTCYGDGRIYGSGLGREICLNATTGETIWITRLNGTTDYNGCYYMGKWLKGSLDGRFYCLDGETGTINWIYEPDTFWNYWCTQPAAAYGNVYMYNLDSHIYAINVETGQLAWGTKVPGHLYAGFPVVADGKLYTTTGYEQYRNPVTGVLGTEEYACLDAITGEYIWSLPVKAGTGYSDAHSIAFGNLYISPIGYNEIWCIGPPQPWSMFLGDAAHTAEGSGPANLALKWKYQTNGIVISSPAVVDGVVYAGSHDENVYALDAVTGNKIWSFATDYAMKSSPAVVDNKVYTGSDDGNIYCIDATTGIQLWKNTEPGDIMLISQSAVPDWRSSPTVVGGRVYVGSLDTNFYCLNANTGATIWTFPTGGPITSSAAVVDGAVYITSSTPRPNGILYKLDRITGSVIWQLSIPYVRSPDMHASPTVADGMVFIPADSGAHYGINATTGDIIWTIEGAPGSTFSFTYLTGSITYAYGRVYMSDPNMFTFSCYNATTGEKIWSNWLSREQYSTPVYACEKIYIGMENSAFYILDALTGEKISYYEGFVSNRLWSSPALYNGRVYIGCLDGNIYCFETAFPDQ